MTEERTIQCPRCEAVGKVVYDALGMYRVFWSDRQGKEWEDSCVTRDDLASPDFGCGFDP